MKESPFKDEYIVIYNTVFQCRKRYIVRPINYIHLHACVCIDFVFAPASTADFSLPLALSLSLWLGWPSTYVLSLG